MEKFGIANKEKEEIKLNNKNESDSEDEKEEHKIKIVCKPVKKIKDKLKEKLL